MDKILFVYPWLLDLTIITTIYNSEENPSQPGDLFNFILQSVFEASPRVISRSKQFDSPLESFGISSYERSLNLFKSKSTFSNLFCWDKFL